MMGIKADLDLSKLMMWNRQNNVRLRLFWSRRLNSINFFHWRWVFYRSSSIDLTIKCLRRKLDLSQIRPRAISAEETISIKRVSSYIHYKRRIILIKFNSCVHVRITNKTLQHTIRPMMMPENRPQQFKQLFNEQNDSLMSEYISLFHVWCSASFASSFSCCIFVVHWSRLRAREREGIYVQTKTNSEMLLMWHIEQKPVVGRHAFSLDAAAAPYYQCVWSINRPAKKAHTRKKRSIK